MTASLFIERLNEHQSDVEREKYNRYFKMGKGEYGEGDIFMGVRMGQVFELAKEFIQMPLYELEKLMESAIHEHRAGALSIMDKRARLKKTSAAELQDLYDLYLRRHDRVNNWDLVDLAGASVVGRYLVDKPRDILYSLARSANMWERRTSIVATYYFLKEKQIEDTLAISTILLHDPEDLIHKAVGGGIRWVGQVDSARHLAFLDEHAATMPRVMLRYAIEHLDSKQRKHYLALKV